MEKLWLIAHVELPLSCEEKIEKLLAALATEVDLTRGDLIWTDITWTDITEVDLTEADLIAPDLTHWLMAQMQI